MSPIAAAENGSVRSSHEGGSSIFDIGEYSDFVKLLERPRTINVERKRSFDERSFSEMSNIEHLEYMSSSILNTTGTTPRSCYDSHLMVSDAWETLRRSVVHFRGQPVGTLAAVDSSVEQLNYDQVNPPP